MENKIKTKKSPGKKILDLIGNILITLYIIAVILLSVSVFTSMKTGYPSVMGYSLLFVRTDSMEGDAEDAIFKNDLVLCHEQDSYLHLDVGAIIAYRSMQYDTETGEELGEIVKIHRIIEKLNNGMSFRTRGDNSPDLDGDGEPDADAALVRETHILGVYEGKRIPNIGKVFDFLQSQNGILFCLVIPMAAFFIWALFKFIKAMVEYKLSKAPVSTEGELTEAQKQAAIAEYLAKQAAAPKEENNTDNLSEE